MEEGETKEKWQERVAPLLESDMVRKDGEETKDHLRRMFEIKSDVQDMAPEVLMAIVEIFELPTVTEKDVDNACWPDMLEFIHNVLSYGRIPCGDFAQV